MGEIEIRTLLGLWGVFYLYWLVSAFSAKRTLRWNRAHILVRLGIAAFVLALIYGGRRFRSFAHIGALAPLVAIPGLVICALGLGLAIWARMHIGRNWGMPMSVKENPELVTTGPYRYIRHPIYSGILAGLLGSALVSGTPWFVFALAFGAYFVFASRTEERLMTAQFPDQYPAYMQKTKALIPFVW